MVKTFRPYIAGAFLALSLSSAGLASAQSQTTYATSVSGPSNISFNAAGVLFAGEATGTIVSSAPAGGGVGSQFVNPVRNNHQAIIGPDDALYVTEPATGTVGRYAPGSTVRDVGDYASGFPTGGLAVSLAFDSTGRLLGAQRNSTFVYVAPAGGGVATLFATGLTNPRSVVVDPADNVYILNESGEVKRVGPAGGAVTSFSPVTQLSYAMAMDATGKLYVADYFNHIIRVIPATGGAATPYHTVPGNPGLTALAVRDNVLYAGGYNTSTIYAITLAGPAPAAVPTLSEWAMILFGTILAGGAALYIQRRKFTA